LVYIDQNALDLSNFRIQFRTTQTDGETPNLLMVRVFNLKQDTITKVLTEFNTVSLEAGYQQGAFAVVYSGQIVQFKRGKLSAIETYLDIFASDGQAMQMFGTINVSLPAAANGPNEQLKAIAAAAEKQAVKLDPGGSGLDLQNWGGVIERGKVMSGGLAWHTRQFARNSRTTWSVQNGKLTIIKRDGYREGTILDINSRSGMIGIPEATADGINVRILLNPVIEIGQRIHINNAAINQTLWPGQVLSGQYGAPVPRPYRAGIDDPSAAATSTGMSDFLGSPRDEPGHEHDTPPTKLGFPGITDIAYFANVTADGIYRVLVIEHNGDTRGNDWYTDMVALAVDPTRKPPEPVMEGTPGGHAPQRADLPQGDRPMEGVPGGSIGTKVPAAGVPKDIPKGQETIKPAPAPAPAPAAPSNDFVLPVIPPP
jgi:hypothetical protein